MQTILKSNDPVYISWIKSLLTSNSISFYIMDEQMSVMEGNITAIPVRVVVDENDVEKAKTLIKRANENIKSTKFN